MARFLITVWPFSGHVHPNLAIAHALRGRGHEVAFFSGAEAGPLLEEEGFPWFPFRSIDQRIVDRIVLSTEGILSRPRNRLALKNMFREWLLGTVETQVTDLEQVLDGWAADAIVCDPTMWGPFLVLHEKRHIPVAVFSLIPACHLSGPDGPILGFPLPRPRNALGRLRARLLRALVAIFSGDVRREASKIRRRHGLAPLPCSVTDYGGRMPLYMVPGSPDFDYNRDDLPSSVHYVGPCLWTKTTSDTLPDWIYRLPQDQPVVYVSEGTINLKPRVLRAAAQGLAHLPIQVILTTGPHRDPESLDLGPRPLATNIHVEQWVPLNELLPRLDAMVTIGGPSTLLPALLEEIPVVVVPYDWDHPETAWRIQESGAGLRLAPADCTPKAMRKVVRRVLTEPTFKQNVKRLAESLRRPGGAPYAARLLERLVSG